MKLLPLLGPQKRWEPAPSVWFYDSAYRYFFPQFNLSESVQLQGQFRACISSSRSPPETQRWTLSSRCTICTMREVDTPRDLTSRTRCLGALFLRQQRTKSLTKAMCSRATPSAARASPSAAYSCRSRQHRIDIPAATLASYSRNLPRLCSRLDPISAGPRARSARNQETSFEQSHSLCDSKSIAASQRQREKPRGRRLSAYAGMMETCRLDRSSGKE